MASYILTIGTQADLTLHRIALQQGITEEQVLTDALNTYATLIKYQAVYVQLPASDSSTPPLSSGLRRIALP